MVYKCEVQNQLGNHLYLRGKEDDVYDIVDHFFFQHEGDAPMIIEEFDHDDDIFVHLMYVPPNLYCDACDIVVNSKKQMLHHIKGRKHQYCIDDSCVVF